MVTIWDHAKRTRIQLLVRQHRGLHCMPLRYVSARWWIMRTHAATQPRRKQIISQNGATSGFEMYFAPSTFVTGGKTRLESSIKRF